MPLPPCLASTHCSFVPYTNSESPISSSFCSMWIISTLKTALLQDFILRSCRFYKYQICLSLDLRLDLSAVRALEKPLYAYCMPYCTHSSEYAHCISPAVAMRRISHPPMFHPECNVNLLCICVKDSPHSVMLSSILFILWAYN